VKKPFITFEGGEGGGKSTQIGLIEARLKTLGIKALVAREPGATLFSEKIRQLILTPQSEEVNAMTELLLFLACRSQIVSCLLKPILTGEHDDLGIVLLDRFVDSSLAYQGYARGLDIEMIKSLNQMVVGQFMPDMTFLLNIDSKTSAQRTKWTKLDRIELEAGGFHDRVKNGYLELANEEPERFVIIDASKSIEEVHEEIFGYICQLLKSFDLLKD